MKLFLLLMACAICTGHFLYGQEPIYNWGEPSTNNNLERKIDKLLTIGDEGFVLLRKETAATGVTKYWIESYGTDMKLKAINDVKFSNGVMGDSYFIEDILVNNGIIYAFISHLDKTAGNNSLILKIFDLNGEMSQIAVLDEISATKMGNSGRFVSSFSDDGSKLLIMTELPFVKKSNEKIRMTCFEVAGMKELWSYDKELDWPSKRAVSNEVVVDNKGRAYLFKRIPEKQVWHYEVYTIDESGNLRLYNDLKLDGKEVVDYHLCFDNNNEFLLYATYTLSPSAYEQKPHGTLFMKFDADQKRKTLAVKPWSSDIITAIEGKNAAEKPERAFLSNFRIKDIVFTDSDDAIVLMEQKSEKKDVIEGSSPIRYAYTYEYGDFLAICLNGENGLLKWWQTFNKVQEVKINDDEDPYGSFVYFMKEDRLYILWNNTPLSIPSIPPANWTEPDGTKYIKHKAFDEKTMYATFLQVIEPNGSLAYADRKFGLPLFNLHYGAVFEMSMNTNFFFELNGNLGIMASMHNGGKRYRFGLVNL